MPTGCSRKSPPGSTRLSTRARSSGMAAAARARRRAWRRAPNQDRASGSRSPRGATPRSPARSDQRNACFMKERCDASDARRDIPGGHVLQGHAGLTQRALGRRPHRERKRRQALERRDCCGAANSRGRGPRTASAATATVSAPQDSRSASVPRTAEPALITSLTIATRLPRSLPRSTARNAVLHRKERRAAPRRPEARIAPRSRTRRPDRRRPSAPRRRLRREDRRPRPRDARPRRAASCRRALADELGTQTEELENRSTDRCGARTRAGSGRSGRAAG